MKPHRAPSKKVMPSRRAKDILSSAQNALSVTCALFWAMMIAAARDKEIASPSLNFLSQLFCV